MPRWSAGKVTRWVIDGELAAGALVI